MTRSARRWSAVSLGGLGVAPALVVDPHLPVTTQVAYFLQAAARNRQEVVDGWLKVGMDVQVRENAAFLGAVQAGHTALALHLIDVGADPWARDGQALVLAARGGHLDLVEGLLDRLGPLNVLAMRSWPLSEVSPDQGQDRWQQVLRQSVGAAVLQAHRPVVQRLVQAGADLRTLPEVVTVMEQVVEQCDQVRRASMAYGHSVRARLKASMNASPLHRHADLVTDLLTPEGYGSDDDGRLLALAVRANRMAWLDRLLTLATSDEAQLSRMDAALAIAESHGIAPMVDVLRPRTILAQRAALLAVADSVRPDGAADREAVNLTGTMDQAASGHGAAASRETSGVGRRRL